MKPRSVVVPERGFDCRRGSAQKKAGGDAPVGARTAIFPSPLPALLAVQPLTFPAYALSTRQDGGKTFVFDAVRRTWVRLTPEEWVRQHLLGYLKDQGYPVGLTAVEKGFAYEGRTWRADAIVFDRTHKPLLLAECKAPEVPVNQAVFDQLARYNVTVRARCLLATNGLVHYCCVLDPDGGGYRFLDGIPSFADLTKDAANRD